MSDLKLYLVTRRDLHHGVQAAQMVHGTAQFAVEHTAQFVTWNRSSNVVVCLAVEDETELVDLLEKLESERKRHGDHHAYFTKFREPDLHDQLTCVALLSCPCDRHRKLCAGMRLSHA